ncbi:MAG: winged helix DNA-binding domain-containing protein [bacterium]|nr:winged helix DNA-binding domain-containing protein [bacterium]
MAPNNPPLAREISLQRIVAQRLAGPKFPDPAAAVSHMSAMQGQNLRAASEAVALRCAPGAPPLAEALAAGTVVRSWPMRGTLHLATAADLPAMLTLTATRQLHTDRRRREELGLTEEIISRAAALALSLIDDGGPASRADLTSAWANLGVERSGVAYHLTYTLAVRGVLVQGPPHPERAGEQLFVRYESLVGPAPEAAPEELMAAWAARFGRSHGPVTEKDLSRWTGLPITTCRAGLRAAVAAGELEEVDLDGTTYWRDPELPDLLDAHREEAEDELLLPAFDELILGYADRSATLRTEHELAVVPGKNGVFRPVAVRDGRAYGTWAGTAQEPEIAPFA